MRGLRILLVEPHAPSRRAVEALLKRWDAVVVEEEASTGPWDFALIDASGIGSEDLTRSLVERHAANVIWMTRTTQAHSTRRHSASLGVAQCLTKPVCPRDLAEALATVRRLNPPLVRHSNGFQQRRNLAILVAEDNVINQKLATRLLEKWGHNVTLVTNGAEALDAVGNLNFDLVLMDIQMPVMDGMEAVTRIREHERGSNRHLPVIALTAHAMKEDEEMCIAAGMDGYVTKPIDAEVLQAAIRRVLA